MEEDGGDSQTENISEWGWMKDECTVDSDWNPELFVSPKWEEHVNPFYTT